MQICFKNFVFEVVNEKVFLHKCGDYRNDAGRAFVQASVCGENKQSHLGAKMYNSTEGERFVYHSHGQSDNCLEIIQRSPVLEARTTFIGSDDCNAVRIYTEVKNITDEEIVLEEVSAFTLFGIAGEDRKKDADEFYFTRFLQSHHVECQPRRASFREWGLFHATSISQKRIAFANVGSWSTKEELPQGIIENATKGSFTMFQIESPSSWYYEISDDWEGYYLYLGGANFPFGGWSKSLKPGESYRTPNVALSFGNSLDEVVGEMTKYRRQISGLTKVDESLPPIFNEYMHLSWDCPSEETTRKYAPVVAKTGVEYYVIDCAWHNEELATQVYHYVGQWKESKARFPSGMRAITDYIRSLGMKAGLWIEPEVVGWKCQEMLDYYDDSCFLQRNGKKVLVHNRYFLDYRNAKVRDYMSETIRRMVEDYGADYIKCDYNQDCGVGTDYMAFCAGEGLESAANAFMDWMEEQTKKYPQVVFEGCSSGGMRMDYKTLSVYSLISTSDQVEYLDYPYIAGNVLTAVIPEQAAVWSYPVGTGIKTPDVSGQRIIVNMINSFLGRMHLASHIDEMNEEQLALVKEGVDYYNALTEPKKKGLPYFPIGLTAFGADCVAAGFKTEEKIYLAVWCLKGATEITIPILEGVKGAKIGYPTNGPTKFTTGEKELRISFASDKSAAFFEIEY